MDIFTEISRTNAAYCVAHGFSSAELYGTPPNEAERETSLTATLTRLNAMGPLAGLSGRTAPRPAPAPHAVVEYAVKACDLWESKDITPYYDECRAKHTQSAGIWVGD